MRRSGRDLERDGDAVWIRKDQLEELPRELARAEWADHQYFSSLLLDDVRSSILRDPRLVDRDEDILDVQPPCQDGRRLLSEGLSWRQPSPVLQRSLDRFLGQCAHTLLLHQRADYEIVYLRDPESGEPEKFQLFPLTPFFYRDEGETLVQTVPPHIAAEFEVDEEIHLTSDRVIRIQLPRKEWEDKYESILLLAAMPNSSIPDFVIEGFRDPAERVPFDFEEWKGKRDLAALKASAPFGWDVRGLPEAPVTTYYRAYRALTWFKFLATLRDQILDQLNEGLQKVRGALPQIPEVEVSEEYSSEAIGQLFNHLEKGQLPPQIVLGYPDTRGGPLTQWTTF